MRKILTIAIITAMALPMLVIVVFIVWGSFWTTDYTSRSPDGAQEISVQTRACFADCVLRIVAHQGWSSDVLIYGNDCTFHIAHTVWIGKIAVTHIPASGCAGFHFAYDFETRRQVDPQPYESALREDVQRVYAVTPQELRSCNGDVLKWMNYNEPCMYLQGYRALEEFHRRHPR
jgi:hypothetical protein